MSTGAVRPSRTVSGDRLLRGRRVWLQLLLVLGIVAAPLTLPSVPIAAADGFSCKEAPTPQFPNDVSQTTVDATTIDGPGGGGTTGYDTYGWAGLDWYTYDLGCGEDLVRAPDALADTNTGNMFAGIGKTLAAAAFWLDAQTTTGSDGVIGSALSSFDRIVGAVVGSLLGVYRMWLGIGLMIVASLVLWRALRADAAGVTRAVTLAAAGLALGALFVGAPQQAISIADDTFGSVITDTQNEILGGTAGGGDGAGGGGETADGGGPINPRDVLLDQVFLPDWRKGWFGTNYDQNDEAGLGPSLRNSLAFTYEEQARIAADPDAQSDLAKDKGKQFDDVVASLEKDHGLSYFQFQGKDSGRTSTGFMIMLKLGMPSTLWIGASVLKLTALLMIRFAILFAPFWVPLAMVHGPLMTRVAKVIGSAYLWAVAAAVMIAGYLKVLVELFDDSSSIDSTLRLWLMILLTVVVWAFMRPFKRLTQTITQNSAGLLNRSSRGAKSAMRKKLFQGAMAATGAGAIGSAVAGQAADRFSRRGGRDLDDDAEDAAAGTPVRPEGKGLNTARRRAATGSTSKTLGDLSGAATTTADTGAGSNAGVDSPAGRVDKDTSRTRPRIEHVDSRRTGRHADADDEAGGTGESPNAAVFRGGDVENLRRTQLGAPASGSSAGEIGVRWSGGEDSAIAPMDVYTPRRPGSEARRNRARTTTGGTEASSTRPPRSPQRLWDAPPPGDRPRSRLGTAESQAPTRADTDRYS